ncbi:hypothetical protein [Pseudonocardia sp. ICBG601]|uniref:hypothetical protein n=1 Tax=Pseudonocardia sp. ICBG601 TaxID=2846759 RepID=UPI001CF60947|nr:hypothetical protein [Pseudonocardia sp. ICBG601]
MLTGDDDAARHAAGAEHEVADVTESEHTERGGRDDQADRALALRAVTALAVATLVAATPVAAAGTTGAARPTRTGRGRGARGTERAGAEDRGARARAAGVDAGGLLASAARGRRRGRGGGDPGQDLSALLAERGDTDGVLVPALGGGGDRAGRVLSAGGPGAGLRRGGRRGTTGLRCGRAGILPRRPAGLRGTGARALRGRLVPGGRRRGRVVRGGGLSDDGAGRGGLRRRLLGGLGRIGGPGRVGGRSLGGRVSALRVSVARVSAAGASAAPCGALVPCAAAGAAVVGAAAAGPGEGRRAGITGRPAPAASPFGWSPGSGAAVAGCSSASSDEGGRSGMTWDFLSALPSTLSSRPTSPPASTPPSNRVGRGSVRTGATRGDQR